MEIIRQRNTIIVPELARFIPFKAGATWTMLWKILYYTRLFKYVRLDQYKHIQKTFQKICSKDNLYALCETGIIQSPSENVFITTDKALPILREAGFNTITLPEAPRGKGDINEQNNTDVFITLMKDPHFFTLLYPNFGYLIPDTLLVQKHEEQKKYKLTFIEVEQKKPEWDKWIENKKNKYLRLSTDIEFFNKWSQYCESLRFPKPNISKTFFNYKIIKWMD